MNAPFPTPGRFEAILAGTHHPANDPQVAAERYTLRGWADGYEIRDRGDLIATFHGPQVDLAWKLVRLLRADAERSEAEREASRITFRAGKTDWPATPNAA